jgi:hypothetical protein
VKNPQVPQNVGNLTSLATVSFSRKTFLHWSTVIIIIIILIIVIKILFLVLFNFFQGFGSRRVSRILKSFYDADNYFSRRVPMTSMKAMAAQLKRN